MFRQDCVEWTLLSAAVDLIHPDNTVILSRRFLPSEGSDHAARCAAKAQ